MFPVEKRERIEFAVTAVKYDRRFKVRFRGYSVLMSRTNVASVGTPEGVGYFTTWNDKFDFSSKRPPVTSMRIGPLL